MDEPVEFEIERLSWDEWNRVHIERHGVTPAEVSEVISGRPVVRRSLHKQRLIIIGPTFAGRMLKIVIGPDPVLGGVYYPFTAHPVSRKERRKYHEAIEGESS
ncbi:MAG: BrnT family toxin [Thermomicrobiales bacterium]